jgi:hypothetical protein
VSQCRNTFAWEWTTSLFAPHFHLASLGSRACALASNERTFLHLESCTAINNLNYNHQIAAVKALDHEAVENAHHAVPLPQGDPKDHLTAHRCQRALLPYNFSGGNSQQDLRAALHQGRACPATRWQDISRKPPDRLGEEMIWIWRN